MVDKTGEITVQSDHRYFSHIDGLRALAIIPVVLYHLLPQLCPGGFVGVDVFFVISGYLITRGIVADLRDGCFSFHGFYVRRIKRILPAYFVVLVFVLAVFPFLYNLADYIAVCKAGIFSAFYSANIYFLSHAGYFDLASRQNPLLHLWSLGVEEQFYLASPLFFWLLWSVRKNLFALHLILVAVASLVFGILAIQLGWKGFAFYMLPSRAWELLVGSIISQISVHRKNWAWVCQAGAGSGLLLVLAPCMLYNDQTPFPGLASIPPVLGAALLILFGTEGMVACLLSLKPVVYIGKISYSLYLWHWPLMVLVFNQFTSKRVLITLAATVVASCLSYRFVELPVRRNNAFGGRQAFTLLTLGSLAITLTSWLIPFGAFQMSPGLESRITGAVYEWNGQVLWPAMEKNGGDSRTECSLYDLQNGKASILIPIGHRDVVRDFVLWGDSHALSMMPGVDTVASERGKAGYYINLKHSLTMHSEKNGQPYNPKADREPVLQWLESRPDLKNIFLVNRWFVRLTDTEDVQETLEVCTRLERAGKRVFFFQNAPVAGKNALRLFSWGLDVPRSEGIMDGGDYRKMAILQDELVGEITRRKLAVVLPTEEAFREGMGYRTVTSDFSYFHDGNHLSHKGAWRAMAFLAPWVWPVPGARQTISIE